MEQISAYPEYLDYTMRPVSYFPVDHRAVLRRLFFMLALVAIAAFGTVFILDMSNPQLDVISLFEQFGMDDRLLPVIVFIAVGGGAVFGTYRNAWSVEFTEHTLVLRAWMIRRVINHDSIASFELLRANTIVRLRLVSGEAVGIKQIKDFEVFVGQLRNKMGNLEVNKKR